MGRDKAAAAAAAGANKTLYIIKQDRQTSVLSKTLIERDSSKSLLQTVVQRGSTQAPKEVKYKNC